MKAALVIAGIIGMLTLAAGPGMAQISLRAALEAGYVYSEFDYEDPLPPWDPTWNSGFSAGFLVELSLPKRLGLIGGIRYVRYANRVDFDTGSEFVIREKGYFEITQDYISWPALVKFGPFANVRLFVIGGAEFGFITRARQEGTTTVETTGPSDTTYTYDDDIENRMEPANLSVVAGMGYELPVLGHTAIVQVRYHHGLTGTAKEEEWPTDWSTRAVELTVGLGW